MPPPPASPDSPGGTNSKNNRQWQAALNLLWAASHQGHNAGDTATMMGMPTESLMLHNQVASGGPATNLSEFLRTVPHFYLLSPAQLTALADFGMRRDYAPGEVVLEDDAEMSHVRVILAGVVDVVDRRHGTVGTMEACSVFGLDSVIVQERSPFRFVCSHACSLLLLPAAEVLRVIHKSPSLRQSIGRKMSGQMSCFRTLKDFSRLLFSHDAMKYEYLPLQSILESYSLMSDSVVHKLKSRSTVDTTAWLYALRRLPENITRVFSLDLVRSLPPFLATRMRVLTRKAEKARLEDAQGGQPPVYDAQQNSTVLQEASTPHGGFDAATTANFNSSVSGGAAAGGGGGVGLHYSPTNDFGNLCGEPSREIRYVHTAQRRRCVWQLGIDGKNIVLMRDDFTDTLDFVLCLLIHIVESSKLRARLQCLVCPSAIDILEEEMVRRSSGTPVFAHQQQPQQQPTVAVTGTNGGEAQQQTGSANNSEPTPSSNSATMQARKSKQLEKEQAFALQRLLEHKLRLSETEAAGIIEMWGSDALAHLHDVLMHREEYLLRADSSVARRFQSDPFHDWALGVRGAVVRRICLDMHSPLPDNLCIDIVFGFTRGFLNCLSPCARMYREELLAYGHKTHPEVMAYSWTSEEDKLYALVPDFLTANPEMQETFNMHLEECGIEVLEDTALTGLQADIICTDLLDPSIDMWLQRTTTNRRAGLKQQQQQAQQHAQQQQQQAQQQHQQQNQKGGKQQQQQPVKQLPQHLEMNQAASNESFDFPRGAHFLINVDYTFGAQAEGILKTLATVFGHRIRSINICGKIAGFKGNKAGDIVLADNVVASKMSLTSEDHMDEIRTINNHGMRIERVQEYLGSKRKVRRGSVLTVATAMLCDETIINYYKNVWNCVGFDIEGSYFARMVKECKTNGLLIPDLATRHIYLVRELPEETDGASTFARERYTGEVLSAQYAIARSVLDLTLRHETESDAMVAAAHQQMMHRAVSAPPSSFS